MQYRHFGKIGVKPSLLGFGAMRFPVVGEDNQKIDEEKSIEMIRYAIDNGVNYVDTAYPYHGGNSELVVAKALKDGYREKTYLATKNPTWFLEQPGDFTKYLDEQLKKLEVDYIDFYLQHALSKERWDKIVSVGFYEEAMKAKADGKIKYFGFSFHDSYETFEEIVNAYDWDFVQIQYNYLDTNEQAGTKGLKLAASKGMGVIVMEPLRGGKLGNKMPDDIKSEFERFETKRSHVDWALRWVANQPEVSLLLSGMSSMEQVVDNVAICSAEDIAPGKALNEDELKLIEEIADIWNKRTLVGCTGCNYCMPCPAGVKIPDCFSTYNVSGTADASAERRARKQYEEIKNDNADASKCVSCGLCVEQCPQMIPIPEKLAELHKILNR